MRNHWYKPGFWLWWWRNRLATWVKALLAIAVLTPLALAGYLSATMLTESESVVFTERVVTVTRTTMVKGKPRVIIEVRTTRLPAETERVTVRRNGKTVVLPGETVTRTTTIEGPVRKRVVTRYKTKLKNRTIVETTTVPRDRVRVVTLPGVTLPGTTIQGPERVVTLPERVVTLPERVVTSPGETVVHTVVGPTQTQTQTQTVTGPTQTVTGPTQTVTGPTQTVTQTQTVTGPTQTVTHTVTETETVTVTSPPGP